MTTQSIAHTVFGEFSQYCLHTFFQCGQLRFTVADAEVPDYARGGCPSVIRESDDINAILDGLGCTDRFFHPPSVGSTVILGGVVATVYDTHDGYSLKVHGSGKQINCPTSQGMMVIC